jgi:hypothetical protein
MNSTTPVTISAFLIIYLYRISPPTATSTDATGFSSWEDWMALHADGLLDWFPVRGSSNERAWFWLSNGNPQVFYRPAPGFQALQITL